MIEESPETFISRWKRYAADVEMFAHTEGSPLLECRAGSTVLQLFERTGPYLSRPGAAKVIINPGAERLERVTEPGVVSGIESRGLSNIVAVGQVLARDGRVVVIDAGIPLVTSVASLDASPLAEGTLVRLVSEGPIHGFVVSHQNGAARRSEAVDESI